MGKEVKEFAKFLWDEKLARYLLIIVVPLVVFGKAVAFGVRRYFVA
jgi:hypothetical protein